MRKGTLITLVLLIVLSTRTFAETQSSQTGRLDNTTPYVEIPVQVSENGTSILVEMSAQSGNLDPLLYLVDENGAIVSENDDYAPNSKDARIDYRETVRGRYTLIATRYNVTQGDTEGDFSLSIELAEPQVRAYDYDTSASTLSALGFPQGDTQAPAEWTVLAYYAGDSDLEQALLDDLREFAQAGGSDERVRIIALLDRSAGFSTEAEDWQGTRLLEISTDADASLTGTPLADLGAQNTGDGALLSAFLVWGAQSYPAQRYALAFGGHGGGWSGVAQDYSTNDAISPLELDAALTSAKRQLGIQLFDLLINDACFMGAVEYYKVAARHFAYSLGSPEIVVNPALDMTLLTQALKENPQVDLSELGRTLVDIYIERDAQREDPEERAYLNFAMTDLSTFDPVANAADAFAEVFNSDPTRYAETLGAARVNAYTFAAFLADTSRVDLGHLMQQVIAYSDDVTLVNAARQVLLAIENSRIYGNAGELARPLTSYYSIYFPVRSAQLAQNYLLEGTLSQWARLLVNYYNVVTPRLWTSDDSLQRYHPTKAPEVRITGVYPSEGSTVFPPVLGLEVTGNRLSEGQFSVDRPLPDGRLQRLLITPIDTEFLVGNRLNFINYWRAGVDLSQFNWLPLTLPVVSDGTRAHNELLLRNGNTSTLEGRYRPPQSTDWFEVVIVFDAQRRGTRVIAKSDASAASISIPIGSEFQAYRYISVGDGIAKPELGNIYLWGEQGLSWSEQAPASADYTLGIFVRTLGGASGYDSLTLRINNDGIDPDLRGITNTRLGINLRVPASWTDIADFDNVVYSQDAAAQRAYSVYVLDDAQDNIFQIWSRLQSQYLLTSAGSAQATQFQGRNALAVRFSYQTEDGQTWQGRGVVVYQPSPQGGKGLLISAAQTASAPDTLDVTWQTLADERIFLFDIAEAQARYADQWRYERLNESIAFPLPHTWSLVGRDRLEGDWWHFAPSDASEGIGLMLGTVSQDSAESALDAALARFASSAEDIQRQLYYGDAHVWHSVSYRQSTSPTRAKLSADKPAQANSAGAGGTLGRIYATLIDGQVYVLHLFMPEDAQALNRLRTLLEPIVDGFAPPLVIRYAFGSIEPSMLKAALLSAEENCPAQAAESLCLGDGILSLSLAEAQQTQDQLGTQTPLADIRALALGRNPDGSLNPFSVALFTFDAAQNGGRAGRMVAFGGTTLINRAFRPSQALLSLSNSSSQRLNIRALPNSSSAVIAVLNSQQSVLVVGRSQDSQWLRVLVPDGSGRTGWMLASLFAPVALDTLPTTEPSEPYYASMRQVDVYIDPSIAQLKGGINGLLIQAPPHAPLSLSLNGTLFEVAAGGLFFWRADLGDLSDIEDESDTGGVDLLTQRRPSAWSAKILKGSVRVFVRNQAGERQALTSLAGTQIDVSEKTGTTQIQSLTSENQVFNTFISTSVGVSISPPLAPEQVQEVIDKQDLLNQQDVNNTNLNPPPPPSPTASPTPVPPISTPEVPQAPVTADTTAGTWGACGSCDTCGASNPFFCAQSPEGACIAFENECRAQLPPPPPTEIPTEPPFSYELSGEGYCNYDNNVVQVSISVTPEFPDYVPVNPNSFSMTPLQHNFNLSASAIASPYDSDFIIELDCQGLAGAQSGSYDYAISIESVNGAYASGMVSIGYDAYEPAPIEETQAPPPPPPPPPSGNIYSGGGTGNCNLSTSSGMATIQLGGVMNGQNSMTIGISWSQYSHNTYDYSSLVILYTCTGSGSYDYTLTDSNGNRSSGILTIIAN